MDCHAPLAMMEFRKSLSPKPRHSREYGNQELRAYKQAIESVALDPRDKPEDDGDLYFV